jgi:hypothetical protein
MLLEVELHITAAFLLLFGSLAYIHLQRPHTQTARTSSCSAAVHISSSCCRLRQQHKHRSPLIPTLPGSGSSTCLQRRLHNGVHQIACRSSSFNSSSGSSYSGNPARDSVDIGLSILEADSWLQLYEVFYGYCSTPSYQHCYAILLQLAEQLPEMQLQPGIRSDNQLAGTSAAIGAGAALQQPGLPGSNGSSSGSWEAVWQALHARGKVQSWTQVTRLRVSLAAAAAAAAAAMKAWLASAAVVQTHGGQLVWKGGKLRPGVSW